MEKMLISVHKSLWIFVQFFSLDLRLELYILRIALILFLKIDMLFLNNAEISETAWKFNSLIFKSIVGQYVSRRCTTIT